MRPRARSSPSLPPLSLEPALTLSPALPYSLWDLAAGKTMTTLTHHHKSVRSIAIHPTEYSFATASAGGNNIKKWACPNGTFVHNFSGHDAIINSVSVNHDGVFFSGGASPRPPPPRVAAMTARAHAPLLLQATTAR